MQKKVINPYFYIIISFLAVVLVGTLLLWLPFSVKEGNMQFIDALFMSTSAVCVTGLATVNIAANFTLYGKIVLLILIEIGGLSFLTIVVFFASLMSSKLKITHLYVMREALNQNGVKGVLGLIRLIVGTALSIQVLGVIACFFAFRKELPDARSIEILGYSIFHTISSFNNAGFDTFGPDSLIPFANSVSVNVITMALIVIGGLGFVVIHDLLNKPSWDKFTLHSKIVLITTAILLIVGTLLFKVSMGDRITWLQSAFMSVTTRTAGFMTFNMSELTPTAYVISIFMMIIGASPCSTGGGIKTTTLFIIIITIASVAGRKKLVAFNRKVSNDTVIKAFALVTFVIIYLVIATCLMTVSEAELLSSGNCNLQDIVFEVSSAFGTVGLSSNLTPNLSVGGKVIISLTMLCGRMGPLTIINLMSNNWLSSNHSNVDYLEASVLVG